MDKAQLERDINKKLYIINSEIKRFINKTGNQNITQHDITLIEIKRNDKTGNFNVSLKYHIEKLPDCGARDLPEYQMYDPKRANHTVFIGALIEFKADGSLDKMVSYNTEIRYCELYKRSTPTDLNIISGFHFDFDKEASINHPIFHVQPNDRCCKRLFVEGICPDLTKYKFINEDDLNKQNKFIRIPTPQMDIFSSILMIFADYIIHPKSDKHKANFRNFIDKMKEQIIYFDYSSFENINPEINKPLLHHWYPHHREKD